MINKKEEEEYSLKDQLNSILTDMPHSEPMKMLKLINPSLNSNSAEWL